jgi:outer membrane lipoprotein SlyB
MSHSADAVIERVKVREVAGVFRSRDTLHAAADALLRAGFDRADIDEMAEIDAVRQSLGGVYVAAEELVDVPGVPRRPLVAPDDIGAAGAVVIATAAGAGAIAAVFAVIAAGGGWGSAVAAAALAGFAAGGIAAVLVIRYSRRAEESELETTQSAGGIVLWVRVRSPEQEEKAQQILRGHSARAVRVHELPLEKRVDELPLSTLRPDPWLDSERLGEP